MDTHLWVIEKFLENFQNRMYRSVGGRQCSERHNLERKLLESLKLVSRRKRKMLELEDLRTLEHCAGFPYKLIESFAPSLLHLCLKLCTNSLVSFWAIQVSYLV